MAHTTHIAPLDLAPTGHLPAIVAQAALTPAQADGLACIHCGREDGPMVPAGTVNGTQVFRCSPACPTDDTAREHTEPAGLLTEAEVTPVLDEELGFYRTTRIESDARDISDVLTPAEQTVVPFLSAEIVISDWKVADAVQHEDGRFGPGDTIDGRFTEMWLHYGTSTGTVTPAKARELAGEMRAFAARLEALCDRADELAADDHEAQA